MNEIKKIVAIVLSIVIVFIVLVALITGNFHIGKSVDKEPIVTAIQNTYNSEEMEYDYTFQGRIAYKFAGVFGPWADAETIGNVKWNNDETLNSNFIVYRESSGFLLFDTNEYIYNIGDSIFVEKIDNEFDLTYRTTKGDFDSTYTFETDIFGDILRDINDDDISSVTYYEDLGIYNVKFSDSISSAFANQMSSLAQTAFSADGSSNPVSLSMDCEIILKDGYVDTFEFSISLEIADVELSFEFTQTFVSFDNVIVEIPHHENIITGQQLDDQVDILSDLFGVFFSVDYSNFSFDYRNQIDAGVFSLSLGTDFRGTHKVKELNGIYYFNNYYELDSDYKPELPDQKQSIALINNEEVECWLELFNLTFNDFELLDDYESEYETQFTNLDYELLLSEIDFVIIDESEENVTYKLGLKGESVFIFFDLLNESIGYNAYQYGRDLEIGVFEISILVGEDENIEEIEIFIEGKYIDVNDIKQNFTINLDYESNNIDVEGYEIPTNKEDMN